jgi:diaminohydroxyphosphoribosylaminopyrimidine deaminase / 5-amino-6-(5-phosphoribosylamino)uracil reductase
MKRALALAARGRGWVHPNPMVGAILVRSGRRVGQGCHRKFGQAHAEVEALRRAGVRAKGSTLYVTLEPCAHWGKTPPCVQSVIAAQVKRVVAAMRDPNPLVGGRGLAALRRAGVSVTTGVLEKEAAQLNRAFSTWVRKKRPFVTLKRAVSLDGRVATVTGESQWITGPRARRDGHRWRAVVDAIAVGAHTVRADDPSLTAHGRGRNPIRIVFDSRLQVPLDRQVFNHAAPTWVLVTARAPLARRRRVERKGAQVIVCRSDPQGRVSVPDALRRLAQRGIAHLLVEGGAALESSFLAAGRVDEAVWYIAPMVIGNSKRLKDACRLKTLKVDRIGVDIRIRGSWGQSPHP